MTNPVDYAYPIAPGDVPYWQPGMTLRDYYAGQALAGMAANQVDPDLTIDENAGVAAHWAYAFADAMLAAREQGQ